MLRVHKVVIIMIMGLFRVYESLGSCFPWVLTTNGRNISLNPGDLEFPGTLTHQVTETGGLRWESTKKADRQPANERRLHWPNTGSAS